MTNEAQKYSETIAQEVNNLETVAKGPDADGYEDALAALEMDDRDELDGDPVGLWMTETPLDFSVRVDTRGPGHGYSIVLLRTTGGPHCEIRHDSNDGENVEIVTWWASDFGRVRVTAPNLLEMMRQLVGALA